MLARLLRRADDAGQAGDDWMNRRKRLRSTQTVRPILGTTANAAFVLVQALILAALIVWLFDAPVRPAY